MSKPLSKVQFQALRTVVRFHRPVSAYEVGVFTPRVPSTERAEQLLANLVERGMIEQTGEDYRATDWGRASAA